MATDEDRAVEAFLARRSSLNERYAELSAAESDAPPAALDAEILKAARDGVAIGIANAQTESESDSGADSRSRRPSRLRSRMVGPFGQHWMAPLGLAAVVVLSVSVVALLPSLHEDEFNAPNIVHRDSLSVNPGTGTNGAASSRETDRRSTESPADPAPKRMPEPPADRSPDTPPPPLIGQRHKQSSKTELGRLLRAPVFSSRENERPAESDASVLPESSGIEPEQVRAAPTESELPRVETQRQTPRQASAPDSRPRAPSKSRSEFRSEQRSDSQLGSHQAPDPTSIREPSTLPDETGATPPAPRLSPPPSPSTARKGIIPASPQATSGPGRRDQFRNPLHPVPKARIGSSNQAVTPGVNEGRTDDDEALSRDPATASAAADEDSPAAPKAPDPHDEQIDKQRFDAAIVRIRAYVSAGLEVEGLRGIRELRNQFPSRKLPPDLEDFARQTR